MRQRIEALWTLANLPQERQRDFWGSAQKPERFLLEVNELGIAALDWMRTRTERVEFGALTEKVFSQAPWANVGLATHWYAAVLRQWNNPLKGSLAGVPLVLAFEAGMHRFCIRRRQLNSRDSFPLRPSRHR